MAPRENARKVFQYAGFLYCKQTLLCCLAVCTFDLVLSLLYYFYWYETVWPQELVTISDLALRTVAWGAVCVYLHSGFSSSDERNFPFHLRIWWAVYSSVCCFCLVIDFVVYEKKAIFPIIYLISDICSSFMGLFLCYVWFSVNKYAKLASLEETLLNGNSTVSNSYDSNKTKGYENAGLLGVLTFSWLTPLIALGNKKILNHEDLPKLSSNDSVYGSFPNFRENIESKYGGTNRVTTLHLAKTLIFSVWKGFLLSGFFAFLNTCASYAGPYLIETFVQYLNGRRDFENEGYILALAFLVAKLVEGFAQRHWVFRFQQVGVRVQAMLVAMIYTKGLNLSSQAKEGRTSGEIINLMTVDAARVGEFCWYMHDPWITLLQIILALLILYKSVGLASIAALVATVILMLANSPLVSFQKKFQGKLMETKDRRMKATSEILKNMRILKLQAWEMKFLSKIIEVRNLETIWLKKYLIWNGIARFLFSSAPTFVAVVTFGACILLGIPLESGKILSTLATIQILQQPMYSLPDAIAVIAQTKVSLERIASFLCLDDLQPDIIEKLPRGASNIAIEIVDGNFSWDFSSTTHTLQNINVKVGHGMKVAVCGTVGSGKSSLLSCILGEVPKLSGTVKLCGTKAYVAQSPWIQSGKIEESILFGKEMDREKYERVLEACALTKDLEVLPFGDQTIIGERGINLSGGQKQRVQIARALYQDADIYLFDDPFSAVDAHTGSHLFKECLLGLLNSKTVIYVTHQVEFLPAADLILVMKDGKITQSGKYNDILNSGTDFVELVGAHRESLSALKSLERKPTSKNLSVTVEDTDLLREFGQEQKEENKDVENGKADDTNGPKGQLVQEEEREQGKVGFGVYWKYIRTAYGGALCHSYYLPKFLTRLFKLGAIIGWHGQLLCLQIRNLLLEA
ncbi:hypothetical protein L6164_031025 [Bauhinia variegata]|uniref:Uncharacterized protein n=1 Tax=Bauhinia variegata TaxID=167791 RepID=A0ACB9LEP7_BAUVA|nr:hypothetical protein L6164_031025 [Bauhinia variegata]